MLTLLLSKMNIYFASSPEQPLHAEVKQSGHPSQED